jgi:hypothetical protein
MCSDVAILDWVWKVYVVIVGVYNINCDYVFWLHFDTECISNWVQVPVSFLFSLNLNTKRKARDGVENSWMQHIGVARDGTVGWGTALQGGRSRIRFPMVLLEFFIDIILPAALWPWGRLSL